jgi:hypothetical protein
LQNKIKIIHTGNIEINNQENIIQTLREINHLILSRPQFLQNIEFENITANYAIVHGNRNIIDFYFK